MKNNFKTALWQRIMLVVAFSMLTVSVSAQSVKPVPGQFIDNYGAGHKQSIRVTEPGKYLFTISNPDRKIGKDNMLTGKSFKNRVKVLLYDQKGKVTGSNYFSGNKRAKIEPYYMESFVAELAATGTWQLEILPTSPAEKNRKYLMVIDALANPFQIMGMDWDQFLTNVAGILAFIFVIGLIIFIKLCRRKLSVADIEKHGAALRAAKAEAQQALNDYKDPGLAEKPPEEIVAMPTGENFCGKCGLPRQENEKFCGECGQRFED